MCLLGLFVVVVVGGESGAGVFLQSNRSGRYRKHYNVRVNTWSNAAGVWFYFTERE